MIKDEIMEFTQKTGISIYALCVEASIPNQRVYALMSGKLSDIMSASADKLRSAMRKLAREAK